MYGNAVWQVARKEYLQHFRTRRLFVVATLLAVIMVLATVVAPKIYLEQEESRWEREEQFYEGEGRAFDDEYRDEQLSQFEPNAVMMFYLGAPLIGGYMFIQLVAIILTSDSVCSEWQNRTIFLLLSKPVPRSAFLLGKYLGTVAALSTVIVAVTLGVFVAMNLLLREGNPGDGGAYLLAVGVLVLGAAAFAAFSLFTSSITRSSIMSTLAGLGAWLFIFPLVGSAGFLVAYADEDFRNGGQFDFAGAYEACGHDPRFANGPSGQEPADNQTRHAYLECIEPFNEEYQQFYERRGLAPWFDASAASAACIAQEAESGEYAADCWDQYYEDDRAFQQRLEAIRHGLYDEPRVDWSRYLSPAATMSIADDILRNGRDERPYEDMALSPATLLAGADATPANPWLGAFSLVAFSGAFVWCAVLVVKRRDFE